MFNEKVIQEISKIFRFGINEQHKSGITHQSKLEEEIGDLLCMIDLMIKFDLVNESNLYTAIINKQNKLKQWSKIYD